MSTPLPRTTAIVGLGLIGGSVARELAARGVRVLAHDRSPGVIAAAIAEGVVERESSSDLSSLADAELVIVATPVDAALAALSQMAPTLSSGAVVTDVGSTKRAISMHAESLGIGGNFVGSHPLAGDHRSGWPASRLGLFVGVPVFLCPTSSTTSSSLDAVAGLWSELGASCQVMDAEEHDRRMAMVSHLPQVVSSALAGTLLRLGVSPADLGPGGRDLVRLAGSSPEMWSAICAENAAEVVRVIDELQRNLTLFRTALSGGDDVAVESFFRDARNWHAAVSGGEG